MFLHYNEAWRKPPSYTEKLREHALCGRYPAAFSQNCYGDVLVCFPSLCIALVCTAEEGEEGEAGDEGEDGEEGGEDEEGEEGDEGEEGEWG